MPSVYRSLSIVYHSLFAQRISRPDDPYPSPRPPVRPRSDVSDKGDICMSILFKNCSWDQGWTPALSITTVLLSLGLLLSEPNTGEWPWRGPIGPG